MAIVWLRSIGDLWSKRIEERELVEVHVKSNRRGWEQQGGDKAELHFERL
jgi:hypothetical protein